MIKYRQQDVLHVVANDQHQNVLLAWKIVLQFACHATAVSAKSFALDATIPT
jgi:hypothetical protein